jgi:hypothetical protein
LLATLFVLDLPTSAIANTMAFFTILALFLPALAVSAADIDRSHEIFCKTANKAVNELPDLHENLDIYGFLDTPVPTLPSSIFYHSYERDCRKAIREADDYAPLFLEYLREHLANAKALEQLYKSHCKGENAAAVPIEGHAISAKYNSSAMNWVVAEREFTRLSEAFSDICSSMEECEFGAAFREDEF